MSLFKRLFRVLQAEGHGVVERLEDPVKMTEQGLRDLQKDLENSLRALAEAKAVCIGIRREVDEQRHLAADYEKKAILLLQKAETGELSAADGDRLAGEALLKKETALAQATASSVDLDKQEETLRALEGGVQKLKEQIQHWQSELKVLKSRAKIANATKKLNKQLAGIDSSSTVSMLHKMKEKVHTDEALAESYGEVAKIESGVDGEIARALGSEVNPGVDEHLAELKEKLRRKV